MPIEFGERHCSFARPYGFPRFIDDALEHGCHYVNFLRFGFSRNGT